MGRQHVFLAMRKLLLDIQIKVPGIVFHPFYTPFPFISSQKFNYTCEVYTDTAVKHHR